MVIKSPYPNLFIPQTDLLTYLFGSGQPLSHTPIWINATDTAISLSSQSALQWIKRFGIGLEKLGVKRGEVVMHISPNHIYTVVAYLGTIGAGRIFSGANPSYTADEMAFQMKDSDARIFLVHPDLIQRVRIAAKQAGLSENQLYLFSDTDNLPVDGIPDWQSFLGTPSEASTYQWETLSPSQSRKQIAAINYSSGTTGLPKGVIITHANLVANSEQAICPKIGMGLGNRFLHERWLGFLPLYHAFGQFYTIILTIKLLAPVYIMSTFHFETLLQIIQEQSITHLAVTPPIMVHLSKHSATENYNPSSLQQIICGAGPLSKYLQNECASRFKLFVSQGWGMTELTCVGTSFPDGLQDSSGSVGVLMPNCEAKVVNTNGTEALPGVLGEMYIRGPNVALGYWRNDQATHDTMSSTDGSSSPWLKTGDLATFNVVEGTFSILGRREELIKVSHDLVVPAELEFLLLAHPAIADAAVIGVPGPLVNMERIRAYVTLKKGGAEMTVTGAEIEGWVRGRVILHKWLTAGVIFVGEIPRSAVGKIQRNVLREWAKKEMEGQGEG